MKNYIGEALSALMTLHRTFRKWVPCSSLSSAFALPLYYLLSVGIREHDAVYGMHCCNCLSIAPLHDLLVPESFATDYVKLLVFPSLLEDRGTLRY
jgi:hypothetical protein